VSDHKEEGIPSTSAESATSERNLDEGVLRDHFDILIKAPKIVSDIAFNSLVNWIFFVSNCFILFD